MTTIQDDKEEVASRITEEGVEILYSDGSIALFEFDLTAPRGVKRLK
jgi:hypothetical protein